MSKYLRKGSSGVKGSLRHQFTYYKKRMINRLIEEQAMREVMGGGTIEGRVISFFKKLDYNEIFEKGITRKIGNKIFRFKGERAVLIQIESLRNRASKSHQADNFIQNYINSMDSMGYSIDSIEFVKNKLNTISIDKLTLLIQRGLLPSIEFIYADVLSEGEFIDKFNNSIKYGARQQEITEFRKNKKEIKLLISKRYK